MMMLQNLISEELPSIPNDLVRLILSNLPPESLCRFRCVSKFFRSTISNECLLTFSKTISSADCYRGTGRITLGLDVTHQTHYHPIVRHVPNTFSCIVRRKETTAISSLPSIAIGPVPSSLYHDLRGRVHLGYDPMSKTHKVLHTMFTTSPRRESFVFQTHVFIEGRRSWRRIEGPPLHYPRSDSYVCVGGIMYYTARISVAVSDVVVVAFDLGLETFQFIRFPTIGDKIQGLGCELMRFNGRYLVLVDLDQPQGSINMWLLEDSSNQTWIRKKISSSH